MAEKKKMTEEQKQKMAEGRKKAAEKKIEAQEAKTQAQDARDEKIAQLERELQELKQKQAAAQPQIIQMSSSNSERVHFVWMGEVAGDNIIEFGPGGIYGRIEGKTGSFMVPKDDLSRVLTSQNRYLLNKRWLMIVGGLTDEEKQAFGVDYKEGEVLDRKAFGRLVELGDEMLEIYPSLCKGHREMVAKRYYEAWKRKDKHITRELVTKLNEASKKMGSEDGDFKQILLEMNAADAGEEK